MTKEELMRKAIELSRENVANGGGPFGAVIAKDGEIIKIPLNPKSGKSFSTTSSAFVATSSFSLVISSGFG
jgi:tRNA(Arg) A34 adenosine deaminase TadA